MFFWDVIINVLFALHGVNSCGDAMLFTQCHSGHLVRITGGLWGVKTIIYNIMVELAGHTP